MMRDTNTIRQEKEKEILTKGKVRPLRGHQKGN
jgi:hypothetical protein